MSDAKREDIVRELTASYWMEMETVQNYLANSTNLDGVRAEEIKKSLQADIQEELGHAQRLAARIRELQGSVPGSMEFKACQKSLQPPKDSTDLITVIKGVIAAEDAAIEGYEKVIKLCDEVDPVTQDLAVTLLGDEQENRRAFVGYLTEFERKKA